MGAASLQDRLFLLPSEVSLLSPLERLFYCQRVFSLECLLLSRSFGFK